MSNTQETRVSVELQVEELEERIAPGGLTTAAAAAGQAVPAAAAEAGLATAAAAAGTAVPPPVAY